MATGKRRLEWRAVIQTTRTFFCGSPRVAVGVNTSGAGKALSTHQP
jgi:hypothetical protein